MKVFLIQPRCSAEISEEIFMHEPLALEYLGAGLKLDGHKPLLAYLSMNPGWWRFASSVTIILYFIAAIAMKKGGRTAAVLLITPYILLLLWLAAIVLIQEWQHR